MYIFRRLTSIKRMIFETFMRHELRHELVIVPYLLLLYMRLFSHHYRQQNHPFSCTMRINQWIWLYVYSYLSISIYCICENLMPQLSCANSSLLLIHCGRVMHICISKLTVIGSDKSLSPDQRCPAIIWTNAEILLIGPLGTNLSEILIKIHTFTFTKIHLKILSGESRPFCLSLNVLSQLPMLNPLLIELVNDHIH